jgi:hypothetical protein
MDAIFDAESKIYGNSLKCANTKICRVGLGAKHTAWT